MQRAGESEWAMAVSIAGGTVRGREHRRLLRNNQDGFAWRIERDLAVAAVTDGCSSGEASEVGARLAARWIVDNLPAIHRELAGRSARALAEATCDRLVDYLEPLVGHQASDSALRIATVERFLLFTVLVAVVDVESVTVFGVGDGVVSFNSDPVVLETPAGNTPDYLGYRLLPEPLRSAWLGVTRPRVHVEAEARLLETLLIGTDGCVALVERPDAPLRDGSPVGDLGQFERQPRYLRNPSLLQKRLTVIGELNGRLWDDTTLVMIRRQEVGPCR